MPAENSFDWKNRALAGISTHESGYTTVWASASDTRRRESDGSLRKVEYETLEALAIGLSVQEVAQRDKRRL